MGALTGTRKLQWMMLCIRFCARVVTKPVTQADTSHGTSAQQRAGAGVGCTGIGAKLWRIRKRTRAARAGRPVPPASIPT